MKGPLFQVLNPYLSRKTQPELEFDPRIELALQQLRATYEKIGDFGVLSVETHHIDGFKAQCPFQLRIARDGRKAFEGSHSNVPLERVILFDGTHLTEIDNGISEVPRLTADGEKGAELDGFLWETVGLSTLSNLLRLDQVFENSAVASNYRDLAGGKAQIEGVMREPYLRKKFKDPNVKVLTISAEGYLERVESTFNRNGQTDVWGIAVLSKPLPLTMANPFSWESFMASGE